ncbi:MAG: nucleoside hydrolase [Clostridia bacterium]|nr:nucleoside hydrolase [Clostridia bacterium]
MTREQLLKNLETPKGKIDVVLDTDAYNEIDDQFAIAYLLRAKEKANTLALYAAPFHNKKSSGPADGMERSYEEIKKVLTLLGEEKPVFRGAEAYLPDESTPVLSDAARDLAARAEEYSPEHPLYVVAIGAITNVASAILLNPRVAENTVVVWLGGQGWECAYNPEFNMMQDIAAARVVFASGVPLVQLPCCGVVSHFTVSKGDLRDWFVGKNPVADYLGNNTIAEADSYAAGKPWTRVIWDVTAVAWLLDENCSRLCSRIRPRPEPTYDNKYLHHEDTPPMRYVYYVKRDALMEHLIRLVAEEEK